MYTTGGAVLYHYLKPGGAASLLRDLLSTMKFYRYGRKFAVIMKLLIGGTLTEFENRPHTP